MSQICPCFIKSMSIASSLKLWGNFWSLSIVRMIVKRKGTFGCWKITAKQLELSFFRISSSTIRFILKKFYRWEWKTFKLKKWINLESGFTVFWFRWWKVFKSHLRKVWGCRLQWSRWHYLRLCGAVERKRSYIENLQGRSCVALRVGCACWRA